MGGGGRDVEERRDPGSAAGEKAGIGAARLPGVQRQGHSGEDEWWTTNLICGHLPLQTNAVKIYLNEMLGTRCSSTSDWVTGKKT